MAENVGFRVQGVWREFVRSLHTSTLSNPLHMLRQSLLAGLYITQPASHTSTFHTSTLSVTSPGRCMHDVAAASTGYSRTSQLHTSTLPPPNCFTPPCRRLHGPATSGIERPSTPPLFLLVYATPPRRRLHDPVIAGIERRIAVWTHTPLEHQEDVQVWGVIAAVQAPQCKHYANPCHNTCSVTPVPQVLRYTQGQQYQAHYDSMYDDNAGGGPHNRIATYVHNASTPRPYRVQTCTGSKHAPGHCAGSKPAPPYQQLAPPLPVHSTPPPILSLAPLPPAQRLPNSLPVPIPNFSLAPLPPALRLPTFLPLPIPKSSPFLLLPPHAPPAPQISFGMPSFSPSIYHPATTFYAASTLPSNSHAPPAACAAFPAASSNDHLLPGPLPLWLPAMPSPQLPHVPQQRHRRRGDGFYTQRRRMARQRSESGGGCRRPVAVCAVRRDEVWRSVDEV
eukprot:106363-Chlamydomonas_euryale.AAC.2